MQVGQQTIYLSRILRSAISARLTLIGWPREEWSLLDKRLQDMEAEILRRSESVDDRRFDRHALSDLESSFAAVSCSRKGQFPLGSA